MTLYRTCFCLGELRCALYKQLLEPKLERNFGLLRRTEKWSGSLRGFKDRRTNNLTPAVPSPVSNGPLSLKSLVKPLLFTVGVTLTSFVGCSIWQYERFRAAVKERTMGGFGGWLPRNWLPQERKVGDWRQQCNEWWNGLTEGQKWFAPIFLLNLSVYAAWSVPAWKNTMVVYFASNPVARVVCWPMLLSVFSHYNAFHLAANMFVLHSFSHTLVGTMGKEQATALYLSAGVISSFTSILHKTLIKQSAMSIGASGAVMAMLGFFCCQYPDARLSIIFLPMWTFPAAAAIKVALGVDLAGCLLGWRLFDHAAHLGGTLTGIFWATYGMTHIWPWRQHILSHWHELRGPPTA